MYQKQQSGNISLLILIFGIFTSIVIGGLVTVVASQQFFANRNIARESALNIAEAGINYYKWHLTHDPDDFTDNTGLSGPYIHPYTDPQTSQIGTFSLDISSSATSSSIVEITSTGWRDDQPSLKRTIKATYGTPSLAKYSFLLNANIWFGQGLTVNGPVLSNAGIRQDGVNTSTLKSAKDTYTCGIESGCDPAETKPGIWGNGGPQELWEYPATQIDFDSINVDFNTLKTDAQANGLYLPFSGYQGYHLVFNANGTVSIYEVESTDFTKAWSHTYTCQNIYQTITKENLIATYQTVDVPVILAEDTIWVEGTVNGQVTIVAARFPLNSYLTDIFIPNNLIYLAKDGNHKLGLISQRDIIFGKDVPKTFEVDGALLAQSGRVMRHHYNYQGCKQGNPENKVELIIYGSIISNDISYWNFGGGGGGNPTSGFVKRTITYDPNLYYDPPPQFPSSGQLELISWNEIDNP